MNGGVYELKRYEIPTDRDDGKFSITVTKGWKIIGIHTLRYRGSYKPYLYVQEEDDRGSAVQLNLQLLRVGGKIAFGPELIGMLDLGGRYDPAFLYLRRET